MRLLYREMYITGEAEPIFAPELVEGYTTGQLYLTLKRQKNGTRRVRFWARRCKFITPDMHRSYDDMMKEVGYHAPTN